MNTPDWSKEAYKLSCDGVNCVVVVYVWCGGYRAIIAAVFIRSSFSRHPEHETARRHKTQPREDIFNTRLKTLLSSSYSPQTTRCMLDA